MHSYPVHIAVKARDVLGVYVDKDWAGVLFQPGSLAFGDQNEPVVGQTVIEAGTDNFPTVDESAKLVTQNDNAQAQNNNQGQNENR